jgi:hypothetical protein
MTESESEVEIARKIRIRYVGNLSNPKPIATLESDLSDFDAKSYINHQAIRTGNEDRGI